MFRKICVAGTFDGIHKGHERLLRAAFAHGEQVTIALTSDLFISNFKSPKSLKLPRLPISSFVERKKQLEDWLKHNGLHAQIIPIDDPVGPAATADFDALIVTAQNKKQGEAINARRQTLGKAPLVLIEVSLVGAQDQKPISSTRIREGEIDRTGRLVMPDNMRQELSQPLGSIVSHVRHARGPLACVISVGDMTTKTLLEQGIVPNLIIIDNKVNRKTFNELKPLLPALMLPVFHVASGPGYIAKEAIDFLKTHDRGILEVDGEEDLLVLATIQAVPLGSFVYYGQPDVGMVEVEVTQVKKKKTLALLNKFIVQ